METGYGPLNQHPAPDGTPEEQMQDEILDRPAGEQYNPNPPEVVAENRARLEALNRQLRRDLQEVEQRWEQQNQTFLDEAQQMAQNPEHQAMQPHQQDHARHDPPVERAGQEQDVADDTSTGSTHADPHMRPAEHPGSPVDPDRYLQPPIT